MDFGISLAVGIQEPIRGKLNLSLGIVHRSHFHNLGLLAANDDLAVAHKYILNFEITLQFLVRMPEGVVRNARKCQVSRALGYFFSHRYVDVA